MFPTSAMVKFFAQNCLLCPLCSAGQNPHANSKCLCVVKGHLVPARGYVESGGKKKGTEGKDGEKTNQERFFTEIAKKYLDELKKQEEKLKKKPEDTS